MDAFKRQNTRAAGALRGLASICDDDDESYDYSDEDPVDDYGIPIDASNEDKIKGIMQNIKQKVRSGFLTPASPLKKPKRKDTKYYNEK